MFRKAILGSILAACLMLTPSLVRGSSTADTGNIDVRCTVDSFAEWATAPTITFTDISAVSQTPTASGDVVLYSNVTVTLSTSSDSVGAHNLGVLTHGTSSLPTEYKLIEKVALGHITAGSAAFLTASDFLDSGNTYTLTHEAGLGIYTLSLTVRATVGAAAPDAGLYECGVTLTAAW